MNNNLKYLKNKLKNVSENKKVSVLIELSKKHSSKSFEKSLSYANKALQWAQQTENKKDIANSLTHISDIYFSFNNYANAMEFYTKSLRVWEELNDKKNIADSLNDIGTVYLYLDDYKNALDFFLKALNIFEKINEKKGIADTLHNLGNVYWHFNHDKTLECYIKALRIRKQIKDESGIAISLNNIAAFYGKIGDYKKSLRYSKKSVKKKEELGNKEGISSSLNNIGFVYYNLSKYKIALKYFLKALDIKCKVKNNYSLSNLFSNIGNVYMKLNNFNKSFYYLDQGLKLANKIGAKNLVQDSYKSFSELLYKKNDYKKAFKYYKLCSEIKDSIFSEETTRKITQLQIKNQIENKEKENEIYRLKNVELANANVEIMKKNKELTEAYKQLEFLARTDPLTKLSNRRDILDKIEYEKKRFKRKLIPFTLILVDIDDFKHFNDKYGHDCGDFVLINSADLMKSMLREQDSVGRWGGEEFILLLPETSLKRGKQVAEIIRKKVEQNKCFFNNIKLSITMTFGVTSYRKNLNIDECIKKADEALYVGKKKGKNCVCLSE